MRARLLPASVNQSPGYGVRGILIRHEASERPVAAALKSLVTDSLTSAKLANGPGDVAMQQIAYRTPNYISLFLCPAK